jgi:hypothetical protein
MGNFSDLIEQLKRLQAAAEPEVNVGAALASEEKCPVCKESVAQPEVSSVSVTYPCGHYIHRSCFQELQINCVACNRATTCPVCRKLIHDLIDVRPLFVSAEPAPCRVPNCQVLVVKLSKATTAEEAAKVLTEISTSFPEEEEQQLEEYEKKTFCQIGGITAVVNAMNKFPDEPTVQDLSSWILMHVLFHVENAAQVAYEVGALPALLNVLKLDTVDVDVKLQALLGLRALLIQSIDARKQFLSDEGIKAVLNAMTKHVNDDAEFLSEGCLIFLILTDENPQYRFINDGADCISIERDSSSNNAEKEDWPVKVSFRFVSRGGIKAVVSAMARHVDHEELQVRSCMLLCQLTLDVPRHHFVDAGCIPAISIAIERHSSSNSEIQEWGLQFLKQL